MAMAMGMRFCFQIRGGKGTLALNERRELIGRGVILIDEYRFEEWGIEVVCLFVCLL